MSLARSALILWGPDLLQVGPVGRWAFRMVSQIGVHYRNAVAGYGRAGRVAAGHRLPWVKPTDGIDNFAALQPPFPIEPAAPAADEPSDGFAAPMPAEHLGAYRFTERALGFGWQAQVYGQAGDALREACADWGLALKEFPWAPEASRAGLARNAVYLIRPDGYVAYASRSQAVLKLADYLERFEIRFRSAPGAGGTLHAGLGAPHTPM